MSKLVKPLSARPCDIADRLLIKNPSVLTLGFKHFTQLRFYYSAVEVYIYPSPIYCSNVVSTIKPYEIIDN